MNQELTNVQTGFRKGRGTRDQIANLCWIIKKQENFRKTSTSASFTLLKSFTVWITTNCIKFLKRWEYQRWELPTTWETCMTCLLRNLYATVRTGYRTTDWFQIGKGVQQGCILSPYLFNLFESTSWETLGWMKHKLESRLLGEISITSDMQITPPLCKQKVKRS